jgi:hypothetical protein
MALYSQYPIDSSRYLHILSSHRNRALYPYSTDFEIELPNKSSFEHKVDNNNGLVATDPIYNGYPTEFGYFGSCSSQKSSYNLQLSNLSSDSSNF